jgi:hypothetical protein
MRTDFQYTDARHPGLQGTDPRQGAGAMGAMDKAFTRKTDDGNASSGTDASSRTEAIFHRFFYITE